LRVSNTSYTAQWNHGKSTVLHSLPCGRRCVFTVAWQQS
jgi:hypothetical protein